MILYKKLIRPMHGFPDPYYYPVSEPLEKGDVWYPEDEKEALVEKYKHIEGTFSHLLFDVKYVPVKAEEVTKNDGN